MNSLLASSFRDDFRGLPGDVQAMARQVYRLWRQDPYHNSFRFKRVSQKYPCHSVRIGAHWRAVGEKIGNDITWFWIGPHAGYDHLLDQWR